MFDLLCIAIILAYFFLPEWTQPVLGGLIVAAVCIGGLACAFSL